MFGQGFFHINLIEGLWSCINGISNNFAEINLKILEDLESNGTNDKDYLDGWICYYLFIREREKKTY